MDNIRIIYINGKKGRRPLNLISKKTQKDYPVSKEQRKIYNDNYAMNHKNETFICDVCLTEHSIFSKSPHRRSKQHKIAINIRNNIIN
jgi:hypothetical protein